MVAAADLPAAEVGSRVSSSNSSNSSSSSSSSKANGVSEGLALHPAQPKGLLLGNRQCRWNQKQGLLLRNAQYRWDRLIQW